MTHLVAHIPSAGLFGVGQAYLPSKRRHRQKSGSMPIAGGSAPLDEGATLAMPTPEPSFAHIYAHWFAPVRRWVVASGIPIADCNDLVQDIFLIVYRRLNDFDGTNLAGWLFRITSYRIRDHRRLAWTQRRQALTEDGAFVSLTSRDDNPDAVLHERQMERTLGRVLAELTDKQRVAFELFELDERSGAEIAELQRVSINTIFARLHRARLRLRELLQMEGCC